MNRTPFKYFSAKRALSYAQAIFEETRWCTSPRISNAANLIAGQLQSFLLEKNVNVVALPADGKTSFGGWVMPKCWDVRSATLSISAPAVSAPILADYNESPHSLMMWSPATPAAGLEGDVVLVDKPFEYAGSLKGKFVLIDKVHPFMTSITEWLALRGAVGMISDHVNVIPGIKEGPYLDQASQYQNYANPLWDGAARLPGFSLTPARGMVLRRLLESHRTVRLQAHVDARLYDGSLPLISAFLPGESHHEIVLTAHMDEPGASDNASGTALAMEVMRALAGYVKARGGKLKRGVRFLSSVEARGIQAYINTTRYGKSVMAGINLDMVGCDHLTGRTCLDLIAVSPACPSYLEVLLGQLADKEAGKSKDFKWRPSRGVVINDCHFAMLPFSAPMCCLEQAPDRTYHTSLDTPEVLSKKHLEKMGRLVSTAVLFLADAEPKEIDQLAGLIYQQARKQIKAHKDPARKLIDQATVLWSQLSSLLPDSPIPLADEVFIMRKKKALIRGHLGQKAAFQIKFEWWKKNLGAEATGANANVPPVDTMTNNGLNKNPLLVPSEHELKVMRGMVPLKTFAGYLGWEDLTSKKKAILGHKINCKLGWGAPGWLQSALDLSNGKRSLYEIFNILAGQGIKCRPAYLIAAIKFLRDHQKIRFKTILTKQQLLKAIHRVGIRRGDIVMAHTSLSAFGYIVGGSETVIDCLLEAVGNTGTLVVPTHSLNWVGNTPYDAKTSPSLVGSITNHFLKREGAIRSNHPTHSVAAIGPLAAALVAGHDHTVAPQAREGFWGNFVKANGKVLLMCRLEANTLLHAGELWAGVPYPPGSVHFIKNGRRSEVTMQGMPWHIDSFKKVHHSLQRRGLLHSTVFGDGTIYSMSARKAVATMMRMAGKNPLIATAPDCKCRFCSYIREHIHDHSCPK